MSVYGSYRGISYELVETAPGAWSWSFSPPTGSRRSGRVTGQQQWAFVVVQRAIEVWHLMNRGEQKVVRLSDPRGAGRSSPPPPYQSDVEIRRAR
jgi:hypothetical protein